MGRPQMLTSQVARRDRLRQLQIKRRSRRNLWDSNRMIVTVFIEMLVCAALFTTLVVGTANAGATLNGNSQGQQTLRNNRDDDYNADYVAPGIPVAQPMAPTEDSNWSVQSGQFQLRTPSNGVNSSKWHDVLGQAMLARMAVSGHSRLSVSFSVWGPEISNTRFKVARRPNNLIL